ncbi:hypothetical protein ACHAXR_008552 [Thalassiosira sp. AJA248-18]
MDEESHTQRSKRKATSDPSNSSTYPRRNFDHLHCPAITFLCAIGAPLPRRHALAGQGQEAKPCIPCAYKICNFDIARDSEFTRRIPNQRPEQCPRSSSSRTSSGGVGGPDQKDNNEGNHDLDGTMGYQRGMNVLTVGDGDFTFSLAVARLVVVGGSKSSSNNLNRRRGMVVATSYEDSQTLRGVYPDFDNTLNSLKSFGGTSAVVGYNVDATRLDKTLPKELQHVPKNNKGGIKFHRICWNFPCTAIGSGQDGQNDAMEQNKELVRKFVDNALPYLDEECGEIHMAHKTKPPYNQWGLEKVAIEGIGSSQETRSNFRKLEFKGRIAFDKCTLPPYTPRKALDRKSFPCHDACIYIFGWKGKYAVGNVQSIKRKESHITHITIPENKMEASNDKSPDPSSVIPVTDSVIEKVRSTHLRNAKRRATEQNCRKHFPSNDEGDGTRSKRRKKR